MTGFVADVFGETFEESSSYSKPVWETDIVLTVTVWLLMTD